MNVTVWRIATDTKSYEADDLSGAGAKTTGGRWNEAGDPLVYTSETQALACLETVVHLNAGGLPLNRYLVSVTIPPSVWAAARTWVRMPAPVTVASERRDKIFSSWFRIWFPLEWNVAYRHVIDKAGAFFSLPRSPHATNIGKLKHAPQC